jgi:argininosuccinate lyase
MLLTAAGRHSVSTKLLARRNRVQERRAHEEGMGGMGWRRYTHLQRAQPILLAHELLAYVEQFERDHARLMDARKRVNQCPLGACALAGTGLDTDRFKTAQLLGFEAPMPNSVRLLASEGPAWVQSRIAPLIPVVRRFARDR